MSIGQMSVSFMSVSDGKLFSDELSILSAVVPALSKTWPASMQMAVKLLTCACLSVSLSIINYVLLQTGFFPCCIAYICACATILYCTHGSMFECAPLCVNGNLNVCVCVSRNRHTCRWVFITAGLSDGLAHGRPLFIVISPHLISPPSHVSGDHWRPPLCICACMCTHTIAHIC